MKRKLTPKQRKFANEFIKTNNAYQSAIKAGYSKAYAKNAGKFLLENIGIKNYIQQKTGNVEKRESDEADEVLKNIYRISAGKEIERHYVKIDNLAKEVAGGDDSIEARMEYMTDETTITPASTKEQVAAAELWLKLSGRLKNDSKDVEDQKIRKLKADADIAEAKAKRSSKDNQQVVINFTDDLPDDGQQNA
ncbi:prophage P1 protein 37, terminase small subunit TerS [Lactiplantibacillus plantarum]|uniref:terminase small subunit n=1 Tax=Lactiplantibacillus plantarum TaxID=1590 RepID=UPI000B3C64FA|nr:terminase small subunit [Lactiplantibacillus plantarum]MCG0592332.1 prophage P1 protein 37, terminase small subunit TerS [Lactiplantibacillus plantarum]MCG0670985.1 prophage P1 protein 37, terminase small subunit TerS [Lactiplantibacillus plantarum]MCG0872813.1 prophage P1 protein 37, terminase small subunit TerS [Lactiplantibacillus plantarum]MCG0920267.1 prophage P1 protein 37, terminase small subunit TerS [Lactiplantibacillus plantarum]OUT02702.1 PBSX phage terminase small subunit [Lacti